MTRVSHLPLSCHLVSQFFLVLLLSLSLFCIFVLLARPRHYFRPLRPVRVTHHRFSASGTRATRSDRLRCNWRAHYLVLSHRDNYPRGRFHAPGTSSSLFAPFPFVRLKYGDAACRFRKYSDFFRRTVGEPVTRKSTAAFALGYTVFLGFIRNTSLTH